METKGKCRFCGEETPKAKTRGRPKVYCDTKCQRKWEYQSKKDQLKEAARKRYYDRLDEHRERGKHFQAAKGKNLRTDKVMLDLERGYVSGLFDGEGTIGMMAEGRKDNSKGIRFSPNVCIYNTNLGLLYEARKMMGNGYISKHTGKKKANHKTVYRLNLSANQIRHVLPQIADVLVAKKKNAELILEYLDLATAGRNSVKYFDHFKEIYRQLAILNYRGKATYLSPKYIDEKLEQVASRVGRSIYSYSTGPTRPPVSRER
jgi:hypothetical protein